MAETNDPKSGEEQSKEEKPVEDKSTSLEVEFEGQKVEVTADKVVELAQNSKNMWGVIQKAQAAGLIDSEGNVIEKPTEPAEPEEEPDETESLKKEVSELKTQYQKDKEAARADRILANFNSELAKQRPQHELTKDDPEIATLIEANILANLYMNPNLNVAAEYKKMVDIQEKAFKRKQENYLKKKMNSPKRDGPGGSSALSGESNKFTKDDLTSGKVLEAARKRMESLRSGLGG